MKYLVAFIIFSLIIIFHEFGHFIFAKKCNVQVNEFCLGFGPTIFHFKKGETVYSFKLFLLGGACIMEGEDTDADSSNERAFNNKPLWQKFLIVFAGPLFNFILAYILSVVLISCVGFSRPVISGVADDMPAASANLQANDEIVSLNNYKVHFFSEISLYLYFNSYDPVEITYLRDGIKQKTTLTPVFNEEANRYMIGITGGKYEKGNVIENLEYGVYEVKYIIYMTWESLKMLITGNLGMNDLSGPVGVVKTIGDTYEESAVDGVFYIVMNMINMAILLSANLGVMNLLPIPAIDGGRLLIFIVEGITRKKLNEKVEGYIHLIGFFLLMLLMVFVMFNDIRKIFLGLM